MCMLGATCNHGRARLSFGMGSPVSLAHPTLRRGAPLGRCSSALSRLSPPHGGASSLLPGCGSPLLLPSCEVQAVNHLSSASTLPVDTSKRDRISTRVAASRRPGYSQVLDHSTLDMLVRPIVPPKRPSLTFASNVVARSMTSATIESVVSRRKAREREQWHVQRCTAAHRSCTRREYPNQRRRAASAASSVA